MCPLENLTWNHQAGLVNIESKLSQFANLLKCQKNDIGEQIIEQYPTGKEIIDLLSDIPVIWGCVKYMVLAKIGERYAG